MVRILIHTDVTKYLEFKAVDGSYVLNKGRVEKVGCGSGWGKAQGGTVRCAVCCA